MYIVCMPIYIASYNHICVCKCIYHRYLLLMHICRCTCILLMYVPWMGLVQLQDFGARNLRVVKTLRGVKWLDFNIFCPLVNIQKAIENGHRNSWFTHQKLWFSIVFCMFTRGYMWITRVYEGSVRTFLMLVELLWKNTGWLMVVLFVSHIHMIVILLVLNVGNGWVAGGYWDYY